MEEVRWRKESPHPPSRPRCPRKRAGIRYEKRLGRALRKHYPSLICGPWIAYRERGIAKAAQPDFVLPLADRTVVLEAKHTETEAWEQVEKYKELLRMLRGVPSAGVMVCRRVLSEPDWSGVTAREDALAGDRDGLWLVYL